MKFYIGQKAEVKRTVSQEDILLFGRISGDSNPVHFDLEYARSTPFKQIIAPGLYVASFISGVLANQLPGPGSIYLSQELKFVAPVFIGDVISTEVEIISLREEKGLIELKTICLNQEGKKVIQGRALTKMLEQK